MRTLASLVTLALLAVLPITPALAAPHSSAEVDLFAQALRGMKLVKKAKKNYEPGRGDPCFSALRDLDVEHGHKLVRRTGLLEPPKAGEERVRIDRIYRLTNHGHDDQDNTPGDTPPNLKDLDDSSGEGGEIVWATAMYADQVSVKLAAGKTAKDWTVP